MSLAKAIALVGSFIYLAIFIGSLIFPERIKDFFSQSLQNHSGLFFAITISVAFLLAVVNFSYFYFLHIASENGEKIESAVFLSLQLLILPIVLLTVCLVIIGL